ncbi:hypothetical protein FJY71_07885, partial [candidate division WOR-3 bacterium]|nr:hypothetical protein [candidate division WOR-3 bacterium]
MKRLSVLGLLLAIAALAAGQWIEKTIWLPESLHSIEGTNVFVCDTASGKVYMGGWDAEYLHVLNSATRQKVKSYELSMVTALVHAAPAHRVYAVSPDYGEVWMIDDRTDSVVGV